MGHLEPHRCNANCCGHNDRAETFPAAGTPNTVWGGCGGRIYTTAMATLCLEVYYRYLPLYERAPNRGN